MADIRQFRAFKEDFRTLAVQDPISVGGRWARTDAVWSVGLRVRHPDVVISTGNPTFGSSYFTPESYSNDEAEAWAFCSGGNSSGIHWSIGLVQQPGGSSAIDGYEFRIGATTGGVFSDFWKITNGSYSNLSHVTGLSLGLNDRHWQLIRRNGGSVEGWVSADPGPDATPTTWTMVNSISDSTYLTGLYGYLSMADNSGSYIHGFETYGLGPALKKKPQFIRRPWRYQGKALELG